MVDKSFPEVAPPTRDSNIPLYGIRWETPGKLHPRTGKQRVDSNAWTSKKKAEAVIAELEAKGAVIIATSTRYCGGFAL